MKKSCLLSAVYDRLFAAYGECICPLNHDNPFQLLAAVMLSAQCRDERVNMVTKELFALAPDAAAMAALPQETVKNIIHPCGLSGSKSSNLIASAKIITEKYNGIVPADMESLTALPGIGRKSANVILGNCFNIPGFPVDTHVKRLLNRIGVVKSDSPEKIEYMVNAHLAPEYWTNFSHLLITHGRQICHAGKAECSKCVLKDLCKYGDKQQ